MIHRQALALGSQHLADNTISRRKQHVFHFHGFDDRNTLTSKHLLTGLHRHLDFVLSAEIVVITLGTMAAAILAHPVAAAYLARGEAEKTLTWTDPATGLQCKCRTDFLSRSLGAVVDLKSAVNIESRAFQNAIMRYGYNCQGAHYRNGAIACGEFVDPAVVIIAVEKTAPFDVGVFRLKPDAINAGAADVADLLALLKQCIETDTWPGRYPDEVDMGIPAWATMGDLEMTFTPDDS